MNAKNIFSGVKDTLYIPLAARIFASENFPEYFYDEKALSLKQYLKAERFGEASNEYFHMASACRQYTLDKTIRKFLENNEHSNVVFLGAGLETAYNRIGNTKANFYQIDLPDVIDLRKKVLGNEKNETLIAGDMFDLGWGKYMQTTLPTLLVVSGAFQYFHESKIITMIKSTKDIFSHCELIFDATNSEGLKMANKYVEGTGNKDAKMYFSIDNPNEFAQKTETELISVEGFYSDALKLCKRLKIKTKIYMYFADKWHRTLVVHLKLK